MPNDDPPHRKDLPHDIREVVDKMRGNALIVALLRLGGKLEMTPEVMNDARGYRTLMDISADGHVQFRVVEK